MKSSHLIFLIAVAALHSGCKSDHLQPIEKKAVMSRSVPQDDIEGISEEAVKRTEAFARFSTGISYELNDKSELAQEQFYRAALADPSNERLALEICNRFSQSRQFDKAIEVLSKVAQQPQASGNIFSSLARVYLSSGKTNLAATAAESAVKKSPASISGYQILNEIFLQSGQQDAALKLLTTASRQTNSDAMFLVNLGELYGNLARAQSKGAEEITAKGVEVLDRAARQKPGNPNLRQKLADNFSGLGEIKKAAEIYLELLKEYNDMPLMRDALREKLANLYLQNSDKLKASEQLEAVVRDNPTRYPEAWYYLGNFAYDAKDYTKAGEYFARALLLNPDFPPAYYELAGVQINLGQAGEALKVLDKAREKFSTSFTGEFISAMAFARLKNYSDALKHFTAAEVIAEATDKSRLNYLFYFQIGSAHERIHDYAQAEKYLQKCLQLSPNFADALNYLGFMWADRGMKLDEARELIERALKVEPKNAAYLDSLGWVLYKLKKPQPALEYILQSIALDDKPDASVYDHLGDIYAALKQNEKARDAWQKSLAIESNVKVKEKLK
jgi:tetratricopeptide (TPR) repeat protein